MTHNTYGIRVYGHMAYVEAYTFRARSRKRCMGTTTKDPSTNFGVTIHSSTSHKVRHFPYLLSRVDLNDRPNT